MKIFEQTISLAWGRLILPFTLHSEVDTYNFGHLVNVLERYKPAHLGYGFRIIMQDLQSGYSIYAGHKYRDKVNFSLISGTSKAGRWPWWSSIGQSKNSIIQIRTDIATGISVFQYIGVSTCLLYTSRCV